MTIHPFTCRCELCTRPTHPVEICPCYLCDAVRSRIYPREEFDWGVVLCIALIVMVGLGLVFFI